MKVHEKKQNSTHERAVAAASASAAVLIQRVVPQRTSPHRLESGVEGGAEVRSQVAGGDRAGRVEDRSGRRFQGCFDVAAQVGYAFALALADVRKAEHFGFRWSQQSNRCRRVAPIPNLTICASICVRSEASWLLMSDS